MKKKVKIQLSKIQRRIFSLVILGSLLTVIGQNVAVMGKQPFEAEGKYIIEGALIHGANGIYFDGDDLLHIASVNGREIIVMDPQTGVIIDRLTTEKGVECPDDLIIGPDGSLYWTAIMTGEVGRLSPDGVKTGQFVAPGVNPVTLSDDGRLFVALDFLGDALYELDPELQDPPRLIAENLGFLNGMDFGPDGLLYGPIFTEGRVVRIDVEKEPFSMETVVDGLYVPSAVKFDSQGRLHVTDFTGQVLRVDVETGDREVIASNIPGSDNLAFDSNDHLYVSNAIDGSIKEILPNGEIREVCKGGITLAAGVALIDDTVYLADLFSLREFDGLTLTPKNIENYLFIPGMITSPITVSPDDHNLIISSWFTNEVQVWNTETRSVVENHLDFAVPMNAIRFQGDLIVAELGTGSVVRKTATERITLVENDIYVPVGLAATDDDIWVGDWATGIIWQIVDDGATLSEPIPVAMGLAGPEGLALDLDGNLLVVETGAGRLTRINPETGVVTTLRDGFEFTVDTTPGSPPTGMFNGVAVSSSGVIYISGDDSNCLSVLNYPVIVSTLSERVATIENELEIREDELSSLEGEKTALENEKTALQDEVFSLEGEKITLEDQVSSLDASIKTWRNIAMVASVVGIVVGAAFVYLRTRMD